MRQGQKWMDWKDTSQISQEGARLRCLSAADQKTSLISKCRYLYWMKNLSTVKSGFGGTRDMRSSSLAGSYGVARKTPAKSTQEGIGLNPNLGIQNEYIENLLKQIQFLSMEVKLFKEKNDHNKGMGIMGLIGKDQKHVVEHAIISNEKFAEMKHKLIQAINELQSENLKLEDENSALQSQKDYLARTLQEHTKSYNERKISIDTQLGELTNKLKAEKERKESMEKELTKLQGQAKETTEVYKKLVKEKEVKELNSKITQEREAKERASEQEEHEERLKQIKDLQEDLARKKKIMEEDHKYLDLLDERRDLESKASVAEKELADLEYEVEEHQVKLQLAKKVKERNAKIRKEKLAELDKAKNDLLAAESAFKNRVDSQLKRRELESTELLGIRMTGLRHGDQLNKLREKEAHAQKNYRKYAQQQMHAQKELDALKEANEKLQTELKEFNAINNQLMSQVGQTSAQHQSLKGQFKKASEDRALALQRVTGLEEEVTYLRSKCEFLQKNVHLDEDMKGVKIEDLREMVQNNIEVNETIQDLMGKWDQMRKFSKGY